MIGAASRLLDSIQLCLSSVRYNVKLAQLNLLAPYYVQLHENALHSNAWSAADMSCPSRLDTTAGHCINKRSMLCMEDL